MIPFRSISKEEAKKWTEEAFSKMKSYSLFELEIIENLEKIYESGHWDFYKGDSIFSSDASVGFSPDYKKIKHVSVNIARLRDKLISKGRIYNAVCKAYMCNKDLDLRETTSKLLTFSSLVDAEHSLEKAEELSAMYLTDLLLRGDKSWKKYRWIFGLEYFPFLLNEEKNGIENSFDYAIKLGCKYLSKNLNIDKMLEEMPKPSWLIPLIGAGAYFGINVLGEIINANSGITFGAGTGVLVVSSVYFLKRSHDTKKWLIKHLYNIANGMPPKRV